MLVIRGVFCKPDISEGATEQDKSDKEISGVYWYQHKELKKADVLLDLTPTKQGITDIRMHKAKRGTDVIAKPLLVNFNRSWSSGEVPEDQKKNNVTSISKKVKTKVLESYNSQTIACHPHLNLFKSDGRQ